MATILTVIREYCCYYRLKGNMELHLCYSSSTWEGLIKHVAAQLKKKKQMASVAITHLWVNISHIPHIKKFTYGDIQRMDRLQLPGYIKYIYYS